MRGPWKPREEGPSGRLLSSTCTQCQMCSISAKAGRPPTHSRFWSSRYEMASESQERDSSGFYCGCGVSTEKCPCVWAGDCVDWVSQESSITELPDFLISASSYETEVEEEGWRLESCQQSNIKAGVAFIFTPDGSDCKEQDGAQGHLGWTVTKEL